MGYLSINTFYISEKHKVIIYVQYKLVTQKIHQP